MPFVPALAAPNLRSQPRQRWVAGIEELPPHRNPPCEWCGTVRRGPSGRLRRVCMRCRTAHYCSKECLDAAWIGGLWIACGPASKMRPMHARPATISGRCLPAQSSCSGRSRTRPRFPWKPRSFGSMCIRRAHRRRPSRFRRRTSTSCFWDAANTPRPLPRSSSGPRPGGARSRAASSMTVRRPRTCVHRVKPRRGPRIGMRCCKSTHRTRLRPGLLSGERGVSGRFRLLFRVRVSCRASLSFTC